MAIKLPEGTKDLLPAEAAFWNDFKACAQRVFGAYGYRYMETPILEQTDLFVRGIGEATDVVSKEMFTAVSGGNLRTLMEGGKLRSSARLSLRPEGTAGVVRAVVQHDLAPQGAAPAKLMYAGPMFRAERPQKGRQRQFNQVGIECLGAERAIIAYRRTEDEMPCRKAELHHAKAEGVEVMPLVAPLEFLKGEDGNVCAVRVQKMELGEPDSSGRRRPVPIEGAVEDVPCDVAISAIGTNANPFARLIGGMELNKWGYIIADERTGQTTNPRIWAGGDIVTGAATVILAMGAGKQAAADITAKLG